MHLVKIIFQPTVMLALALLATIVMMILPVPSWLLDVGLAASFALAVLIFTVTLFIQRPLDFSAFPSILLASLVLRLSLNVSSTKLIIGEGHTGTAAAGHVIEGFAMFVMGGDVVLGLVIFGVLLIVNFIVINKGATRMAEVGARFALDAMPGKQLAIDSDVAAGAITHEEAKKRRDKEQAETTFFGSLDGASKFVKGDAIAGLLITALNLVVGLAVGTLSHGMPASEALTTYSVLTVGDGLVAQIPAVLISVASALLLSRGGTTGSTDQAIAEQLGKYPAAIGAVAFIMLMLAGVPGLPAVPFFAGALILSYGAYHAHLLKKQENQRVPEATPKEREAPKEMLGDILDLDDLHVEFAPDLIDMVLDPATGLDARILNMRRFIATEYGLLLPQIRLTDRPSLPSGRYQINVQGVMQAQDSLKPDALLVLLDDASASEYSGNLVKEPVYGAPSIWIPQTERERFALEGRTVVQPAEVLATHLLETVKQNFSRLMTYKSLQQRLDELSNLSDPQRAAANRRLLDELIPERVPVELLLAVLRALLDERVSIRNLPLIIEAISETRQRQHSVAAVTEHVRQRLGFQLVAGLKRDDGTIPLIQLAPEWEELFVANEIGSDPSVADVALPPQAFNALAESIAKKIETVSQSGVYPAVVTSMRRRRFVQTVMAARGIANPALSFEEIGVDARPALVGLVEAA